MASKDKIEKLEDLIKDSIGGELIEQKAVPLLPLGENYGSVMYKVDFKVRKDGEEKEYHAVAKCTPPNQMTQELFNTQESFKAEIAWYTMVIPTLKQFSKKQGLRRELDFFQNFYGARISLDPNSDQVDLDGVILSENLKYLGYKNVDRHIGFDLSTTYRVLKDLATFHAVPMALRHHDPELFDKKVRPYLPTWSSCTEEMEDGFKQEIFIVYDHIPEFQPLMGRIRKRIIESVMFGQRQVREPWVSVQHLDFWCNNIMITEGAKPKIMILDLQCPGYGSVAADVIFFLLTSVRTDAIEGKIDNLLAFYHKELIENLNQLEMPTSELSFRSFCKEVDAEAKAGALAHALTHLNFILAEKGVSTLDANDQNFKYEDFVPNQLKVNERHVAKFKWVTKEADKRRWWFKEEFSQSS